uniref:Histidinol dehydrogenase n=1 Tax=Rhizochromulina marina TaxID=1034831 RepID=A0A7S2SQY6_9STRA
MIIADHTAKPEVVAADLLAQAEHDVDARPILITTRAALVDEVNSELQKQLAVLPTAPVAREAVAKGFAVVAPDMDAAICLSDAVGPEHLEIQTENADDVGRRCNHYGGLFIGEIAAEVLGDYGAGPNHVLPTGGTARYSGGLSVFNFVRIRTWMRIDDKLASQQLVQDSIQLARLEGLEAHARAAEKRLVDSDAGESPTKKQRA